MSREIEKHDCIYGVTLEYDGELSWWYKGKGIILDMDTRFDFCPICGRDLRVQEEKE